MASLVYGLSAFLFPLPSGTDDNCLPLGVSTVPTIARPPHFTIMTIALLKRCEAQRHAGLRVYSFQCGAAA